MSSLHTDLLFGILKKAVAARRDFTLIITSTTLVRSFAFSSFSSPTLCVSRS
jgi:HrpA-like RNA helicase